MSNLCHLLRAGFMMTFFSHFPSIWRSFPQFIHLFIRQLWRWTYRSSPIYIYLSRTCQFVFVIKANGFDLVTVETDRSALLTLINRALSLKQRYLSFWHGMSVWLYQLTWNPIQMLQNALTSNSKKELLLCLFFSFSSKLKFTTFLVHNSEKASIISRYKNNN